MPNLAIQTQSLTKNYGPVHVSGTGGWKLPAWMTMGWRLSLGKKK